MHLDDQERNEIKRALNATWEAIGWDVLQVVADNAEPPIKIESATMPRDHVIEVVLDADYVDMYGRMPEDVRVKFKAMTYEEKIAIGKETFKCALFGI